MAKCKKDTTAVCCNGATIVEFLCSFRVYSVVSFFCHQSCLIQELETRIQKLSQDAEAGAKLRTQLEREKMEMEGKITQLTAELNSTKEKSVIKYIKKYFLSTIVNFTWYDNGVEKKMKERKVLWAMIDKKVSAVKLLYNMIISL